MPRARTTSSPCRASAIASPAPGSDRGRPPRRAGWPGRLKAAAFGALVPLAVYHVAVWWLLFTRAPCFSDFHNSYSAGGLARVSTTLAYSLPDEFASQRRLADALHSGTVLDPFVQLPVWLLVMRPLSLLPYRQAYVLLTIVFVVLLIATMVVATRGLQHPDRILLGLAVMACLPLADAFVEAQTTVPMMVLVAASIVGVDAHPRLSGLLLGAALLRYQTAIGAIGGLLFVRPRLLPFCAVGGLALGLLSALILEGHLEVMLPGIRYGIGGFLSAPFSIPGVAGALTWPLDAMMAILSVATALRVRRWAVAGALAGSIGWVAVSPFVYMHDLALTPLLTALLLAQLAREGRPLMSIALAGALLYAATETAVGSLVVAAEFLFLLALWTLPGEGSQAGATGTSMPRTSL